MARQRTKHAELYQNIELLKSIVAYDETSQTFLKRIDHLSGRNAGSLLNTGYYHFAYKHKGIATFYLNHRIVWILHNGLIPEGMVIDHIDGNTKNNNISNLRLCTFHQNTFNQKINNRINKSGLPSSIYSRKPNEYFIRTTVNRKTYYSHRVDTLEKALKLRDEFKQFHFGEFATKEVYEAQIS